MTLQDQSMEAGGLDGMNFIPRIKSSYQMLVL